MVDTWRSLSTTETRFAGSLEEATNPETLDYQTNQQQDQKQLLRGRCSYDYKRKKESASSNDQEAPTKRSGTPEVESASITRRPSKKAPCCSPMILYHEMICSPHGRDERSNGTQAGIRGAN